MNLINLPTQGTLDYYNRAQKIPNQTPETSQLRYTPINLVNVDSLTYSVSDGEFTDNGVITLQSSTPPTTPTNAVTFTSSLSSNLSRITLVFDQRLNADFNTFDFTLSQGSITSVRNYDNSAVRYLQVSGIPYDAPITVTYVGTISNLGSGVSGSIISGTNSATNSISRSTPVDTAPRICYL